VVELNPRPTRAIGHHRLDLQTSVPSSKPAFQPNGLRLAEPLPEKDAVGGKLLPRQRVGVWRHPVLPELVDDEGRRRRFSDVDALDAGEEARTADQQRQDFYSG
jgi:hypothetical protein